MDQASRYGHRWSPWLIGILVAVVCTGLYLVDRELAGIEKKELNAEARTWFQQAERLASQNRIPEALPLYQRALSLNRKSSEYQVALGRALVSANRLDQAEPVLNTMLQGDPNNGPANLEFARLLVARGNIPAATAYYHRAIYGIWPLRSEDRIGGQGANQPVRPIQGLCGDLRGRRPQLRV